MIIEIIAFLWKPFSIRKGFGDTMNFTMELDREEDGDGLLKSPKFQGLRYMEPAEKMQLIKFKL